MFQQQIPRKKQKEAEEGANTARSSTTQSRKMKGIACLLFILLALLFVVDVDGKKHRECQRDNPNYGHTKGACRCPSSHYEVCGYEDSELSRIADKKKFFNKYADPNSCECLPKPSCDKNAVLRHRCNCTYIKFSNALTKSNKT